MDSGTHITPTGRTRFWQGFIFGVTLAVIVVLLVVAAWHG